MKQTIFGEWTSQDGAGDMYRLILGSFSLRKCIIVSLLSVRQHNSALYLHPS